MDLEEIAYEEFKGFVARPSGNGPWPGVLVISDGWGLAEFGKTQAQRLAGLGYVGLAGDVYGGGRQAPSEDKIMDLATPMIEDNARMRRAVRAGMDALKAVPGVDPARLGGIGFCLGGMAMLELARSGYDCAGVVSYHGLLTTRTPAEPGAVKPSILVCTGADDPHATIDDLVAFQAEMSRARTDCQMVVYTGVGHSFTKPSGGVRGPGYGYHAKTAERSWRLTVDFFAEVFSV